MLFFFQLVASNMLSFEKNSKGEVACVLSKDNAGKSNYQQIIFWSGFGFRSTRYGGGSISYNTLSSRRSFMDYFNSYTG